MTSGSNRCSTSWMRAARVSAVSPFSTRTGLLGDHRAGVHARIDEVDRHAGHLDPVAHRVGDGVGAGKRRQQRGMQVDDPPGERLEQRGRHDAHVAGQHHQVGLRLAAAW